MSFGNGDTAGLPIVSPASMMPVQVLRREVIADGVVSLFLVLPDTEQAPAPYQPGQFVTLAVPTFRKTIYRSYSLCGDGRPDQPWEITIKRLHMGTVSSYLFDKVKEGSLLYASMPRGTFTLPQNIQPGTPLVFVAVGSGITPIVGMLSALALLPAEYRPQAQLHYASKSLTEMIYRRELQELDPKEQWLRRWLYLSSDGNRMTPEAVMAKAQHLALQAHWYMCGPDTLKRDLQGLLEEWEVPDEQIHAEIFTPARPTQPIAPTGRASSGALGNAAQLYVEETGATLDVRPNETLLATLERHGYRPDFSCRAGSCGACKLRVLAGQVQPVGEALSAAERRAGYVLSCIAVPQEDVTIASGGRAPAGGVAFTPRLAPNAVPNTRQTAVMRTRFAALLAVGGLVFGSWLLTNHKPASLTANAASNNSSAPTQPAGQGKTPTGTSPTATPRPGTTTTPRPGTTATPQPGTTATPKPQPGTTPTPKPPTPTPTPQPPKPTPTATSTPTPHQ
ncbi:MAG TPA: 2Fe-2S iron-sulfur cluster-binding protein [Ktedonobacterales bacterium]|nr:2Fe-2S iron-sulfur cluster-binding protein [Ktedonobacterales bacterium]